MTVDDELDALLAAVGAPAGQADDPLELGSLALVHLVDLLEAAWGDGGLLFGSEDLRREVFATRRTLRAALAAKGIA